MALLLFGLVPPREASAQRPFRIYDPLYRHETAQRTFFDRYAFTAEVSYRPPGLLNNPSSYPDDPLARNSDPFGLGFRFDYQLSSHLDIGVILDAAGGPTGRNLSASWVTLKYNRTVEMTDYAFRLAVDPSSDGRTGFPQMDLAFLYRSLLSPALSSDFALGVRRVRLGYSYRADVTEVSVPEVPQPFGHARAVGLELHAMMSYNVLFGPGGSNLFLTMLGQGGDYDLIDLGNSPIETEERIATQYRGGVVWVLSGIEIARPSYQIAPYLGIPLLQWAPAEGEEDEESKWPAHNMHIGLRLMLR
jgi:hypothetical protein